MKLQSLKSNIYDNDKVLSPEGILMFRCRRKKSEWYLSRGLAEKISDDPFTIQLNFVPNGLGKNGDEYYMQPLENICCICGVDSNLTRHHVVPREYRSNFPEEYKSHNHKDVLLACIKCHEAYERKARDFRGKIFREYQVSNLDWDKNERDRFQAKKHALSLINFGDLIPERRRDALLTQIYSVFNWTVPLEEIAKIKINYPENEDGAEVVKKLTDIPAFIERWRTHFLENAKPLFLPAHWN